MFVALKQVPRLSNISPSLNWLGARFELWCLCGRAGGVLQVLDDGLHIIQLGFRGKPILLKNGRFSLYACGNGVDLPHLAKRVFRDQIGPNVQKAMPFGSPSHQGLKNCGFSQKIFFFIF